MAPPRYRSVDEHNYNFTSVYGSEVITISEKWGYKPTNKITKLTWGPNIAVYHFLSTSLCCHEPHFVECSAGAGSHTAQVRDSGVL